MEQRVAGTMQVWAEPFTPLRMPKLFNLRTDLMNAPTSDITSNTYYDWFLHNAYFICVAQTAAMKFAQKIEAFPPAQLAPSFTIDAAMAKMHEAASGALH